MAMQTSKRLLSTWADADLADRFARAAAAEDRSVSAELRRAVAAHLERQAPLASVTVLHRTEPEDAS